MNYTSNDQSLIKKYEFLTTWFANTAVGRKYLSHRGMVLPKKIGKLLPNGYIAIKNVSKDTIEAQMVASVDSAFMEKRLWNGLRVVDAVLPFVTDFTDAKNVFLWGLGLGNNIPSIVKRVHFAQSTFTPDATHVDGRVYRGSVNETFTNIRTGAGSAAQTGNSDAPMISASATTDQYEFLFRRPVPADTSALTSSATIQTTSKFRYYVSAKVTNITSQSIRLVTTTGPGDLTALAAGDYDIAGWGSTGQASDVTLASITTSAYNEMTFTDVTNISKTGVTRLGLRLVSDADNAAPTWVSGATSNVSIDGYSGTNPSQYVIDYTLPGGGAFLENFL